MHLIQRHSVDINCSQQQLGNQIKDEISSVLELDFYPKLEKLLASYDFDDDLWQLDYLPVSLYKINAGNWKSEIVEKSIYQIKKFLDEKKYKQVAENEIFLQKNQIQKINKNEYLQYLLLSYLKTGVLKINALTPKLDNLYNEIIIDDQFIKDLETTFKDHFQVVLRWSLNIPFDIKLQYLKQKNLTYNHDFLKKGVERSSNKINFLEYLYWVVIFNKNSAVFNKASIGQIQKISNSYYNIEEGYFNQLIHKNNGLYKIDISSLAMINEKGLDIFNKEQTFKINKATSVFTDENQHNIQTQKKSDKDKNRITKISEAVIKDTAYYSNNAGLMLLHPFIYELFNGLGYLKKRNWKDKTAQHRAVLLLQYLTDFNLEIFENDLILNKILCGVPISETVCTTHWKITRKEKEQSEKLLQSVIQHWKVLKNTSIKTLQESFLQRSAKIVKNSKGMYEITVEHKSIDLLLDQLPWGLGMIKTPWMEQFLTCYWN